MEKRCGFYVFYAGFLAWIFGCLGWTQESFWHRGNGSKLTRYPYHTIHGTGMCAYLWLIHVINVGKSTSPMDGITLSLDQTARETNSLLTQTSNNQRHTSIAVWSKCSWNTTLFDGQPPRPPVSVLACPHAWTKVHELLQPKDVQKVLGIQPTGNWK